VKLGETERENFPSTERKTFRYLKRKGKYLSKKKRRSNNIYSLGEIEKEEVECSQILEKISEIENVKEAR